MLLTSSLNARKLILVADEQEYYLLMFALEMLRDIEIGSSCCAECDECDKVMQDHAAEVVESLQQQETGIPELNREDGGGEEVPNWMGDNES